MKLQAENFNSTGKRATYVYLIRRDGRGGGKKAGLSAKMTEAFLTGNIFSLLSVFLLLKQK